MEPLPGPSPTPGPDPPPPGPEPPTPGPEPPRPDPVHHSTFMWISIGLATFIMIASFLAIGIAVLRRRGRNRRRRLRGSYFLQPP